MKVTINGPGDIKTAIVLGPWPFISFLLFGLGLALSISCDLLFGYSVQNLKVKVGKSKSFPRKAS